MKNKIQKDGAGMRGEENKTAHIYVPNWDYKS